MRRAESIDFFLASAYFRLRIRTVTSAPVLVRSSISVLNVSARSNASKASCKRFSGMNASSPRDKMQSLSRPERDDKPS